MKFAVFQFLILLMPVAMEVSASMRTDSPGGKKITADERKSFGKLLGGRLLDDDIEDVLELGGRQFDNEEDALAAAGGSPDTDDDAIEQLFSLRGKRITKRERKHILEKLGRRLLDDDLEELLD